ncbi:hypothetical protein F2P81_007933 [Scophthalmus maximus]|uniref:Uncharacterized protein n=1 Tax=Scophthalmus maximus TaxID=52904 RepID=A0A6A4T5Y3_SCOMX|nr:hypothetical protein F2P81_007933 [Scophthalmus maximus]
MARQREEAAGDGGPGGLQHTPVSIGPCRDSLPAATEVAERSKISCRCEMKCHSASSKEGLDIETIDSISGKSGKYDRNTVSCATVTTQCSNKTSNEDILFQRTLVNTLEEFMTRSTEDVLQACNGTAHD